MNIILRAKQIIIETQILYNFFKKSTNAKKKKRLVWEYGKCYL